MNSVSAWLNDQAADHGVAERLAQLRAGAAPEHQRQRAEQRRHRRHHDRPEAQQAGLANRVVRRQVLLALGLDGEVDHHDAVLLDDADQQNDADQRDHRQFDSGTGIRISSAPTPADGSVERMVSGWM